jgi:hypothetical protein
MYKQAPVPAVRVALTDGACTLDGLAVAPDHDGSGGVAIPALGAASPVLAVRESDIVRVEIGPMLAPIGGFGRQ